ncbi:MAG TPA: cysteine desulfurase-like protein [Gemmatimonadales bacterium]|nr:cysteine desulfurase-like protein [Gemmatimonadales bacterium]
MRAEGLARGALDPDFVAEARAAFPALERLEGGVPVAYFDGPGGTQVPRAVADAVTDYLLWHNANTHWAYPTSIETDALLADARETLADFVNGAPDEIAFGANMTTLTFHLARGLGQAWGPGDEVVVTELDHHANVAPWRRLERERGITVRQVPFDAVSGELRWAELERAIGPRTRLVAVGGASNALGTITDAAAVASVARAVGALTFLDAVHYAPHVLPDVRALGVDFLACSAYKFYGPHVGILWGRRELLEAVDVPKLAPAPDGPPEKLETGTQNHEGIVGAATAVEFLASLGRGGSGRESRRERLSAAYSALHERGGRLLQRLWNGLGSIGGVRRYGPGPDRPRTPTVAFTVSGRDSTAVARALAARGVFVSSGDFYAATVVERLGCAASGLVRAGCACYTTAEEVDRLLEGVEAAARD